MVRVAIVGATGYAGMELLRLCLSHPEVRVTLICSRTAEERGDLFPHLPSARDIPLLAPDPGEIASRAEVAFLSVPHGTAAPLARELLAQGVRVIDLSADFRLRSPQLYPLWYGWEHPFPELLEKAVYGLPELHRSEIEEARLVANPGCYPTAFLLALAPLFRAGVAGGGWVVVDAKSGVSGAGRTPAREYLFSEVDGTVRPYAVGGKHRHVPEMEQEAEFLAGEPVRVAFSPHLVPLPRGILCSCYLFPRREVGEEELWETASAFYASSPFVRVLPPGRIPETKWTWGANYCLLGYGRDGRSGLIVAFSALDNLIKGAAGQAIQNLNLMMGFPETAGLLSLPAFP